MTNPNRSDIFESCEERTSKGTETKHGKSSVLFLILKVRRNQSKVWSCSEVAWGLHPNSTAPQPTPTLPLPVFGVAESGDGKGAGCLKLRLNSSCFSATPHFLIRLTARTFQSPLPPHPLQHRGQPSWLLPERLLVHFPLPLQFRRIQSFRCR